MVSTEVAHLYRQVLRAAGSFSDYNFREYFLRRARDDFRGFALRSKIGSLDAAGTDAFLQDARENLQMLQRQSTLSQLYEVKGPQIRK
mmetsp:Transcript_73205/g.136801  ORF Transcript_73205/g.136801 Transcript_73205/m.136801 type:complete len:88 (+) Transcript_73205:78-341(+)